MNNSEKESLEKTNEEKIVSPEEKNNTESKEEDLSSKLNEEKVLLLAEIENAKKRHLKEKSDLIKYSNQKLIAKIIPLLDNYEIALKTSELVDDKNVKKFLSGILMAVEDFRNSLRIEGVEEYSVEIGKDLWDSRFCEVVDEVENNEHEEGTVLEIVRKGYLLNGRMIRPASVVISKKSL